MPFSLRLSGFDPCIFSTELPLPAPFFSPESESEVGVVISLRGLRSELKTFVVASHRCVPGVREGVGLLLAPELPGCGCGSGCEEYLLLIAALPLFSFSWFSVRIGDCLLLVDGGIFSTGSPSFCNLNVLFSTVGRSGLGRGFDLQSCSQGF